jgi:hypothetical protein
VRFIVAAENEHMDVYTGLKGRSVRTARMLYNAQDRVRLEYPQLQADFHTIYAGARPFTQFVGDEERIFLWKAEDSSESNERLGKVTGVQSAGKRALASESLAWPQRTKRTGSATDKEAHRQGRSPARDDQE